MQQLNPDKKQAVKFSLATPNWKETELALSDGKPAPLRHTFVQHDSIWKGDVEGTGMSTYSMTYHCPPLKEGEKPDYSVACEWAGQQLFTGTILGRKGTVAIGVWGTWRAPNTLVTNCVVLTPTATGELKGMQGGGSWESKPEGEGCATDGTFDVEFADA